MKKFIATAKIEFEIEDENEFVAERQATACVLKYILNQPLDHYDDEYPYLAKPGFVVGSVEISDEQGKVLNSYEMKLERIKGENKAE